MKEEAQDSTVCRIRFGWCRKTDYVLLLMMMMIMISMICSITAAYLLSHVFRDTSMQSSTSALGRMNGMISSSVASATRPSPDTNSSIHCEYPNPVCKIHNTSRSKYSREGDTNCLCTFIIYVFICLFIPSSSYD